MFVRIRIGALVLSLALATVSCGNSSPAAPASPSDLRPPAATSSPLHVDEVVVLVAESYPARVLLRIDGSLPDACAQIDGVTQQRTDEVIHVTIAWRRGDEPCAQKVHPIELSVWLDGAFASGRYKVAVNGVERTFQI